MANNEADANARKTTVQTCVGKFADSRQDQPEIARDLALVVRVIADGGVSAGIGRVEEPGPIHMAPAWQFLQLLRRGWKEETKDWVTRQN